MICQGEFVFKGIEEREGGEFVNSQGRVIKFDESYIVKVDEIIDNKAQEQNFKFKKSNKKLAEDFKAFKMYDDILITFNVDLYKSSVKLTPIEVVFDT